MKPVVSVIIPTYNRSASLLKAIRSVLSQTKGDMLEIIVCDDGSTDNTKELVFNLKKKFHNLHYINLPHTGGPAKPRNIGINHSEGDWVAFLDSDDSWSSHKIELQLNFAKTYSYDMVATNAYRVVGRNKSIYFPKSLGDRHIVFSDLLSSNQIICSTALVRKSALLEIAGFPEQDRYIAIEDYLTWFKIATKFRIGYMSKPLVDYHDDPGQTIRSRWTSYSSQQIIVLEYMTDWMLKHFSAMPRFVTSFINLLITRVKTKIV